MNMLCMNDLQRSIITYVGAQDFLWEEKINYNYIIYDYGPCCFYFNGMKHRFISVFNDGSIIIGTHDIITYPKNIANKEKLKKVIKFIKLSRNFK